MLMGLPGSVRVEWSAWPHQRLPAAQLLRRQELALLPPLQHGLNGLRRGLYGYRSLLWAVRLSTETSLELHSDTQAPTAQCSAMQHFDIAHSTSNPAVSDAHSGTLPVELTAATVRQPSEVTAGKQAPTSSMPCVAA